jgi:hypothetical protein
MREAQSQACSPTPDRPTAANRYAQASGLSGVIAKHWRRLRSLAPAAMLRRLDSRALDLSRVDLRRELRALSSERRRAVGRAIREGRAVDDPRDAALAVAWARRVQVTWWPGWALPRSRPRGRRALLWLLHATWSIAVLVLALAAFLSQSHGIIRWAIVGVLVYGVVSMPWVLRFMLRMRWNAPDAERRNRELLGSPSDT